MANLTKPQVQMLTRGMRESVPVSGAKYRTADTLAAKGYGVVRGGLFRPTRAGLGALRDHRAARWGKHGCQAYLFDLQEVEAALKAGDFA